MPLRTLQHDNLPQLAAQLEDASVAGVSCISLTSHKHPLANIKALEYACVAGNVRIRVTQAGGLTA